jgi:membrane fusion protein (multidrug efflux system)
MSESPAVRRLSALEIIWRVLVFGAAFVLLFVVLTHWTRWEGARGWQTTDDAYLQADITPVSAKVAGYVRTVPVQDYQPVTSGQLIAEIVDDDYRAAEAQVEANLASAHAQLAALKAQRALQEANVSASRAVIMGTGANVDQNQRDLARQQKLIAIGSSSTEAQEKIQTAHRQLSAQLSQNRAQADAAQRQLAVLDAQQAQAEAAIAAQEANLSAAKLNLGYTRILAPTDGMMGVRQVLPGQFVAVGTQVTTITRLPHLWVTANYKETQLTHMGVGDQAEVTVDTFPGVRLKGHVIAFAPASGSQFTLLPPDNASGNYTKVVQRIAVRIALDDFARLQDRLRPGMSVVARINAQDGGH